MRIGRKIRNKISAFHKYVGWRWYRYRFRDRLTSVDQRVMFVVGFAKSGKSTILEIFNKDIRTKLYRENSEITGTRRNRHLLKEYHQIREVFFRSGRPLIICEPKLQSHLADTLLREIPHSTIIWMYRDHRDAVCSHLERFTSQIENLELVISNTEDSWRNQGVSRETQDLLSQLFSPVMSRQDAAALFWYARNMIVFECDLHDRPDVILCRYEDLVSYPDVMMRQLYSAIGIPYPNTTIVKHINKKSIGIGSDIVFSPEVETLCSSLLQRMDSCTFLTPRYKAKLHTADGMSP